jgi:hypothetical protein
MGAIIGKRFALFPPLVILSVIMCVSFLFFADLPAVAQDALPGNLLSDPGGVASFMPPRGWIRWDFWGTAAFSPTIEHNPRITFTVRSGNDFTEDQADRAMKDYVRTFSTENYVLVEKENLYLDGWSGVRVLARGTEENTLFGRDYIWIQEYFAEGDRISLVFRSDPTSFGPYRDTVLKSFRSLVITGHKRDGL